MRYQDPLVLSRIMSTTFASPQAEPQAEPATGSSSSSSVGCSGASTPTKLRHSSSASTRSSESNTSSIDEGFGSAEPNELILDQNQTAFAIEVPASTLRIDLGPFKSASEVHAEPGDIIEFDRILSSHWAIYVGDGDVVHVVGSQTQEIPDMEIAVVQRAPITAIAGDNCCRVNNKMLRARERNLLPFHNDIVKSKALSKVGSTVPYNALQCNSEHYVTEWKYGQRWSDQAAMNLSSFSALRRQHTNSLSEGHAMFVNTLNEVMNSAAVSGASGATSPAVNSSTSSLSSTPPKNIATGMATLGQRHRQLSQDSGLARSFPRTISIMSPAGGVGGALPGPRLTRTISSAASFSTAGCQTELSLL